MEEKHDLSVSGIIRTKYDKKEIKITKKCNRIWKYTLIK